MKIHVGLKCNRFLDKTEIDDIKDILRDCSAAAYESDIDKISTKATKYRNIQWFISLPCSSNAHCTNTQLSSHGACDKFSHDEISHFDLI